MLFFISILCIGALNDEIEDVEPTLQIEIPFGNPYKEQLDEIHAELIEVYDIVRECIHYFLMDVPLATGAEIEANCVGAQYSIVNHIFLLKMKKSMELYNKSLTQRFEEAFSTFPDEIAHFMSLYKMFLEKGFHNIYDTMQLAKHGSRYYVQEDVYDNLLELSKDMLTIIGNFSALLVKEKNEIKAYIKEKLIQRDENLKILLRLDKSGVSESVAHEEVKSESNAGPLTLADKIRNMDHQVKEDMEMIESGASMPEDDDEINGKGGSNKFKAFEDNIMELKGTDKAEKELVYEFTPDAIDEHEKNDDDEDIKINEKEEVPEASDPVFVDDLDFWYERNRG